MKSIKNAPASHDKKLTDLEDQSRISNLMIFAMSESPNETGIFLRAKVITDVFKTRLDISCTSVERIRRLGRTFDKRSVNHYFQALSENTSSVAQLHKAKGH